MEPLRTHLLDAAPRYRFEGAPRMPHRGESLPPAPDKPEVVPATKETRPKRRCRECREEKLLKAFGRSIGHPSGLKPVCRMCRSVRAQRIYNRRAIERGTPVHVVYGQGNVASVRKPRRSEQVPEHAPEQVPEQVPEVVIEKEVEPAIAINCKVGPDNRRVDNRPPDITLSAKAENPKHLGKRPPFVLEWGRRMESYQFEGAPVEHKRRRIKILAPCQANGSVFRGGRTVATEINPKKTGHITHTGGDLFE